MKSKKRQLELLRNGIDTICTRSFSRRSGTPVAESATLKEVNGLFFVHGDHLGSASITTDEIGAVVQSVAYQPFGSVHVEHEAERYESDYLYTGKEHDEELGWYYYGARYYDAQIGRFVGVDPVSLLLGDTKALKKTAGRSLVEYLSNPQGINAYSYVNNNPIRLVDPNGEFYQIPIAIGLGFAGGIASQYVSDVLNNYQSGIQGVSVFKPVSVSKIYAVRGTQGAIVGVAALSGSPYIIGGVAVGTSVLGDKWLGQETSWTQIAVDTAVTAGTAGMLKTFPGVPGRLPNFGSKAFFTGKHTQQEIVKETINVLVHGIKETIGAISNSIKELKKEY